MPRRRRPALLALAWGGLAVGVAVLACESRRPAGSSVFRAGAPESLRSIAARGSSAFDHTPDPVLPRARRSDASGEGCIVAGIVFGPDGAVADDVEVKLSPIVTSAAPRDEEDADENEGTTTDEDGLFEIEVPPGDYTLIAFRGEEEVAEVIEPLSLAPGERIDHLELHLAPGVTLDGRVVADGFELDDEVQLCARLHPADNDCLGSANTDEDNTFHLTGLPRRTLWLRASTDETDVILEVSAPSRGVLVRLPPPPIVAGEVRTSSGEPAAGAQVLVLDREQHLLSAGTSDDDGHFSIHVVRRGPVVVVARESELGVSDAVRTEVDRARDLSLTLHPGPTLTGRVVDAASNAPLTRVGVALFHRDGAFAWSELDAAGVYHFENIPPGLFQVRLQESDVDLDPYVEARVPESGPARAPDLRIDRPCRIRGRVVDEKGAPVAGAEIDIIAPDGTFQATRTDSAPDGTFELSKPLRGASVLRAWASGQIGERVTVAATPGREEEWVELRVATEARAVGIVRGPDGMPRAGVRVACGGAERTTAPSGRFDLECPATATGLRVDQGQGARFVPIHLDPENDLYVEVRL